MGTDPDLDEQVVPLAFHVDYWNSRSWNDRFSDAAWTQRQAVYLDAVKSTTRFTPHTVIGGSRQCNGADVKCIHAGVEAAATRPQGTVSLAVTGGRDKLSVEVKAQPPAGSSTLEVMVALYENDLEVEVKGGENAHKTLHNDYVVRRLERAFKLSGNAAREGSVTIKLDGDWVRGHLGVAAFLQDPKTREVFAATAMPLPD